MQLTWDLSGQKVTTLNIPSEENSSASSAPSTATDSKSSPDTVVRRSTISTLQFVLWWVIVALGVLTSIGVIASPKPLVAAAILYTLLVVASVFQDSSHSNRGT